MIGIDEVGRGCLAGPLLAAAVEFKKNTIISNLTDSKKLSKPKREALVPEIKLRAEQFAIGWVWPNEINLIGLTASVKLAMQRAIGQLKLSNQMIIIDGNFNFLSELKNTKCVIKADRDVAEVSAASVLAKVARDNYMTELAEQYPNYGFDSHLGYGTKLHMNAIKSHGVLLDLHRLNYQPILRALNEY